MGPKFATTFYVANLGNIFRNHRTHERLNTSLLIHCSTQKNCYPKREGRVMPILFWDKSFLGMKINRGITVFILEILLGMFVES